MRHKINTIAYLRLPPRITLDKTQAVADFVLPYAVAAQGKLLQTGLTSLAQIPRDVAAAHTVVLLDTHSPPSRASGRPASNSISSTPAAKTSLRGPISRRSMYSGAM